MSDKRFCRHCGKEILADSQFCPSCGKAISEPPLPTDIPVETHPETAGPGRKISKGLILLVVILGLGILGCLGVVLTSQVLLPMLGKNSIPQAIQTAERGRADRIITKTAAVVQATEAVRQATRAAEQQASRTAEKEEEERALLLTQDSYEATEVALQGKITRDWGVPILMLITAEKHADALADTMTKFNKKVLTEEDVAHLMIVPDSFDIVMLWFSDQEMVESKLSELGLGITPAVKPFFLGLKDNYEKLTELEIYWVNGEKDYSQAMDELNRERESLMTEREKIHQAMLLEGMDENIYELAINYYEKAWPTFQLKLDVLGKKMLTPQPE